MIGSDALKDVYSSSISIGEKLKGAIELNVNASFAPVYMGYYKDQFDPVSTFAVSGQSVTGASFVTKTVTTTQALVDGTTGSEIIRIVDEEDKRYTEYFPIESIFYSHRPAPGVAKWVNSASPFQVPGDHVRFYPPSRNDSFKYWRSWSDVKLIKVSDRHAAVTGPTDNRVGYNMGPFAVWKPNVSDQGIWINKIRISLQNYFALPTDYSVEVLYEGSQNWVSVWSNTDAGSAGAKPWPLDGILKIYFNNNAWTSTPDLDRLVNLNSPGIVSDAIKIRGLRLMVRAVREFNANRTALNYTKPVYQAPLEVIEMSPRLVLDTSDSIAEFSCVKNTSESDSPLPVGSISANDAKVTLENYSGLFDFDDPASLVYGYRAENSLFDLYFSTELPSGGWETNRIFYGIIDSSEPNDEAMVELSVVDPMKLLQELKLFDFVVRKQRLSNVIRRILDASSCASMEFVSDPDPNNLDVEDPVVDYFYANDEYAYDALADLAESYQMAIVFNANNVLKIFTKESLSSSATAVATLAEKDFNGTLANIKSIVSNPGKPINDITVRWSPHFVPKDVINNDIGKPLWEAQRRPAIESAWEAEDSILGAAPLVKGISDVDATYLYVDQEGGEYFDWSGYVVIDSEAIAYEGKEYAARVSGTAFYAPYLVKDQATMNALLNDAVPGTRVFFTGRLKIKTRGALSTAASAHSIDTSTDYPYANNTYTQFQCWKTNYYLNGAANINNNRGAGTWKFTGGKVYNLRGVTSSESGPTRNGAESAIRMVGPTPSDFKTSYPSDPEKACLAAVMSYVGWTPLSSDGVNRIRPGRVSAGIRMVGKVDTDGKSLGPTGLHSYAGVMMAPTSSAGQARLSGWYAEIQMTPNSDNNVKNVRLYKVTEGSFSTRAEATYVIAPHVSTLNSYTTTNSTFYDVDLSYWPKLGDGNDGFVVSINGRNVIYYELPVGETFTNYHTYGVYVRGNTHADVDYVYWSSVANESLVSGFSDSETVDTSRINIRDAISGGVTGPVSWWSSDTEKMFSPYKSSTGKFGLTEFGSIAHEVRIVRPTWTEPYLNTYLVKPSVSGAFYKVPKAYINRFGAELLLMNSRRHAVMLGGDTAPLSVSGSPVLATEEDYTIDDFLYNDQQDSEFALINAKVLASRKVFGNTPTTLNAQWIQRQDLAKHMLKFVASSCSIDCDEVEIEAFGNPLLEPGDAVYIYSPEVNYATGTDKFIIREISYSWDNGLSMDISLRRVV